MKIDLTEHERDIVLVALREMNTIITNALAVKINAQDSADDGPEVGILSVPHDSL